MPITRPRVRMRLRAASIVLVALMGLGLTACDLDNPYERGPAPTAASLEASRGPFAVAQTTVARTSVSTFGGGTIYYPTDTSEGTFGAVAISPGFTGTQSSISWFGPRIASHGFVVITIDTLSGWDYPPSRGDQLRAALDHLVNTSSVRGRIDRNRLAVMGHSMGGGGSLEATADNPALQASIPLTPWHTVKNWSTVRTPTLIIGAENDTIASVGSHAEPFYNSLSADLDKAYMEMDNSGHAVPNAPNPLIGKYSVAWLKRFVDDDLRYEQFLCGAPHQTDLSGGYIEEYRDTCPHS